MPKRTDISKILIAFLMGIACLTSPRATFGCELSGPLHVPLEGELQPYYEKLGPLPLESFRAQKIEGWLEVRTFIRTDGELIGQDAPLRKAALTLRNPISGEIMKRVTSDDRGRFEFNDIPPGSYVLQIVQGDESRKPQEIEGNLLIEVQADAELVHLPLLALSMSDCGMVVHKKNGENSLNQKTESPNAQTN